DIGQLDFDDRRPERREAEPRGSRRRGSAGLGARAPPEVAIHEGHEVSGANELDPAELYEKRRQGKRSGPKGKRPNDAVAERFTLLSLWKAEDQDRENHRVVGAEQPFEGHQQHHRQEISTGQRTISRPIIPPALAPNHRPWRLRTDKTLSLLG